MGQTRHALSALLLVLAGGALGCSFLLTGDYSGTPGEAAPIEAGLDVQVLDAPSVPLQEGGGVDAPPTEASYEGTVLADGPVSYWHLDEPSGAVAKDAMGRHDATIFGASSLTFHRPGAIAKSDGKAFGFSGGSALELGDVFELDGNRPFTIEAWVRRTATDNEYRHVFNKIEIGAGPVAGSYLYVNQGLTRVSFERWAASDPTDFVFFKASLSDERFVHLVVTMDGKQLRLYVDGLEVGVGSESPPPATDPEIKASWGTRFIGDIDEPAFYDKALSAERVKAHFDAAK